MVITIEIERVPDDKAAIVPLDAVEFRRQQIVDQSVSAIHRIVGEYSDGVEEADFVLSQITERLFDGLMTRFASALMIRDLDTI